MEMFIGVMLKPSLITFGLLSTVMCRALRSHMGLT